MGVCRHAWFYVVLLVVKPKVLMYAKQVVCQMSYISSCLAFPSGPVMKYPAQGKEGFFLTYGSWLHYSLFGG